MKKKIVYALVFMLPVMFASCAGGGEDTYDDVAVQSSEQNEVSSTPSNEGAGATKAAYPNYDPQRGEGKFTEENTKAGKLDASMAEKGKAVAEVKCFSCHKPTSEKLVGPGWKGVTEKHSLHWIMNFITNPDGMIDKDPELQAQLEICLVRMPNQNLTDDEARSVVEFMRQNDGVK
jgi:mono/diheme cytochrome c family protein